MSPFKGEEYAESLWQIHKQSFVRPWTLQNFRDILKLPNVFGFCQKEGFILCSLLPDDIEILTFAVLPSYRRQGIGKALLTELQEFAIQQNKKCIFLEVKSDNTPAQALYFKKGFEQTGIRKNYYQENGKTVDALCLTWKNPRHQSEDSGSL